MYEINSQMKQYKSSSEKKKVLAAVTGHISFLQFS